jgi:hypothetical protein
MITQYWRRNPSSQLVSQGSQGPPNQAGPKEELQWRPRKI